MSSITFRNGTIIPASWLNEVDAAVFETLPELVAQTDQLTVATLPSAVTSGLTRRFVTDATATTFASVVVGGGANIVPVYSDGTNWRIG